MCCGPESHHAWHGSHHHAGFCGCGCASHGGPRFWTQEEKTAWLERYLEGLREETKAVEERIAALKGED